jgi:putative ABC transport system permease protein
MWHDLRFALRTLRKSPVFIVTAILTLALGIGANTAIFSVVYAVVLRPLPFRAPDRLVNIAEKNEKINIHYFSTSVLNYLSFQELSRCFESTGVFGGITFNLTTGGDPEQIAGATMSPSLLPLLGIQPAAGRGFREGEDSPAAAPVALISEGLWKRRFGGDPSIIGRPLTLNGVDYQLVGIAPRALQVLTQGDLWVPLVIDRAKEIRLNHVVLAVGRLKPGVTLAQAQAEMDAVSLRVGQQYPEVKDWGVQLQSFFHWLVPEQLRTALLVLLVAVALVLLIACANVANLLIGRAAARQKEVSVRTALGAGRGRLVLQLLTESLVLSLLGGAAGVLAALAAVRVINTALPPNLLPVGDIAIDSTVLAFALGVTLATGLLFGLAPAWQTARTDLNSVLKQGGRSMIGSGNPLVRNGLVAAELALATVLLIGAGLLTQSLLHLQRVNLGFQPERLLTFQITLPKAKYPDIGQFRRFYLSLTASLRGMPGIRDAAVSSGIPLGAGNYNRSPTGTRGKSALPPGGLAPIDWRVAMPGYFHAMQIPLVRGRDFTEQDTPEAPRVAIVSQSAARKLWGDDDPIGRALVQGGVRSYTVVGVVGDVRANALDQEPFPTMYFPTQYFTANVRQWAVQDIVVRTAGRPEAALAGVRQKVREMDPELAVSNVRTMDEWIANGAAQPRLDTTLLAGFAAIALLIASIGIYGVLAYSVNRRTREIGVRMALGAQAGDVLRMVVREGMVVAVAGIAVGLIAAVAASRALSTLLFGVASRDPLTFGGVAALLSLVALLACYVPARRASRVTPMEALRDE